MSETKLLLNTRELAALTGFSEGTLRHWVSQGRLPVLRISARCVRFRFSDIQEWLAAKVIAPERATKMRTSERGSTRAKN
jgi:excisionase family DNA binding protein